MSIIPADEAALDGYLTTWLNNKYPHLVNPWFQGTVLGVNGSFAPYTVTLQRLGEPGPDGGEYVVNPGSSWVPNVGDNVECCWRDQHTAYVMWPLGSPKPTAPSPGNSTLGQWQVPAMQLLQKTTLSGQNSVSFPGGAGVAPNGILPQYFSDFRIVMNAAGPGGTPTFTDVNITFNGDSATNYASAQVYASGSNAIGAFGSMGSGGPGNILQMPGTNLNLSSGIIEIIGATIPLTTPNPHGRSAHGWSFHIEGYGNTGNIGAMYRNVWWNSTQPIETITLGFGNALTGQVRLYGIA